MYFCSGQQPFFFFFFFYKKRPMNTHNLKVFQQRNFCTCNSKLVRHILQRCRLIIILEIFSGKQNIMLLQPIKTCIIYLKPSRFHIGLLHGIVMLCPNDPCRYFGYRWNKYYFSFGEKKGGSTQTQRKSVQFSPKFSELVTSRERPEHRSCSSQFYILCLKLSSY